MYRVTILKVDNFGAQGTLPLYHPDAHCSSTREIESNDGRRSPRLFLFAYSCIFIDPEFPSEGGRVLPLFRQAKCGETILNKMVIIAEHFYILYDVPGGDLLASV